MRKLATAIAVLTTSAIATLGLGVAPASATSWGYDIKTCYSGNVKFQVSSWFENNGYGTYKRYHWNAGTSLSRLFQDVNNVDKGLRWTSRENFINTSDTTDDTWRADWYVDPTHVTYCSVRV